MRILSLRVLSACVLLLALPVPMRADAEDSVHFEIARGKAALAVDDFGEAVAVFSSAAAHRPDDIVVRYYLAVSLNRAGRHAEARKELARAPADRPLPEGWDRERAIALLGTGDPEGAGRILECLVERRSDDGPLRLYAAIAAGRRGDLAGMEAHLDAARRILPSLAPETHCIAGALYSALGRRDRAAEERGRAESLGVPPGLRAAYRLPSRADPRKRRFTLDVYTGYEYDSNVSLMPNDADLVEPTGKGSWRYYLDARAAYDFVDSERFHAASEYDLYCGVNSRVSAYNLLTHSFQHAATCRTRLVEPTFLYRYEYSFLGAHQESFLRSHIFETPVVILHGRHTLTRIRYRHAIDRYFLDSTGPRDNRNGHDNLVGIEERLFFSGGRRSVGFGFHYDRYDATGDNWTHNGYLFTWGLQSPLPAGLRADLGCELYLRRFPDNSEGRRDTLQAYTARLSRPLGEHLDAGAGYLAMLNGSTVPLYRYERGIFTLFLGAHF